MTIKLYGNNTPNSRATHTVSFHYAHFGLADLLGHDLLCSERPINFPDGVHPVVVVDDSGKEHQCVMFAWGHGWMRKGLCVLATDVEGARDAAIKFAESAVMV